MSDSLRPHVLKPHLAPLSMGFSRQEYQSGLPSHPPGDLPSPETEAEPLTSPTLAGRPLTSPTLAGRPLTSPTLAGRPLTSPTLAGSFLPLASPAKPGSALVAIITKQYFNVLVFTFLQMPHSPTTFFQMTLEFLLRWRNDVLNRPMDIISRGTLLSGPW